jgi:hypothetical protein
MHETATAEDWYPEHDELPRRRRARLLTPLTVLLMLVLFAACGFIGGVLVEKHQQTTATVVGTAASTRLGAGATGATGASGGFGGRFGALFGGGAASRSTIGTVTNIDGRKLFVTTAAGTMVEVLTTPESKITKSVSVGSKSVHPGDAVVVSGIKASNGTVTASSVSDSGNAGSASGISSLFGAGAGTGTGTSSTTSSGRSTSLFGG